MTTWLNSIRDGINIYTTLAPAIFLPLGFVAMVKGGRLNIIRFALAQLFFLYMNIVFALVFLPLPTIDQAARLTTRAQLIPFYFIADLAKDPCASAVLGVIFNIAMTIPFGMFLTYYCGFNARKVLAFTFLLTAFIEIGQLTGLFFMFQGSYRLFDMDDLIQNTLGGYLGYLLIQKVNFLLPDLADFDLAIAPQKIGYAR